MHRKRKYSPKILLYKIVVLSCVSTLFSMHGVAQKKVFAGYYIAKSGDSVRGFFTNYNQWIKNPTTVQFTPENSGSVIELSTSNTEKFGIDNYDYFVSATGERLINPIDFNQTLAHSGYPRLS